MALSLRPTDLRSWKWKQGHEDNGLEDGSAVYFDGNAPRSANLYQTVGFGVNVKV